ncbi:MAG TPA: branched-chain amino acid ABC transporter permease [Acidimicrobiia bacterium]
MSVTDDVVAEEPRAQARRRIIATFTEGHPLAPPAYRGHQWAFLFLMGVVGIFVPMVFGGDLYHQGILNNVMLYAILSLGFYWCFSLAGQFTFAVFAMYAAGAYVSAWGAQHLGGFWWGFALAMVVTGLVGALTRLVFYRLSPIYFAIATLGVGSLMLILFREWTSFTGGFQGVAIIAVPKFFGMDLNTPTRLYYLMLAVLFVFLAATVAAVRSPVMRELTFSRANPAVASTTGLKPAHLILIAFVVGSAMQGAAGSLYAHSSTFFSLESFDVSISLSVLLMVLLGGAESIYGPVIGAAIVVYLPELLRNQREYADIIYSALVLLIVLVFPTGVAGFRRVLAGLVHRARSS